MDSWNNKHYESNSMVRGYFAGVQDAYDGVFFCVESEVKMSQAAEIVIKYIKDNPEKWHTAGQLLVIEALGKAFPCKNESNKAN
ncbi:MAG: Rap1a/Tai family immunity protein [Thiomonas sp.]|uniref:Rap1a/Tai family immunity protein n=1 Tax=Thiomonas sp. TaxID=2047785 RepID=UPI002A3638EF|nr:Rap1a/Tai family immunity protein [Thiomonas sp.]MDY0331778.1 Rap1a/Tai family immunity protein [Thiomonas sp.]